MKKKKIFKKGAETKFLEKGAGLNFFFFVLNFQQKILKLRKKKSGRRLFS